MVVASSAVQLAIVREVLGLLNLDHAACSSLQVEKVAKQQQEWQQRAEALQASATLLQQTQAQLADSDGLVAQQASVIKQLEQQLLQPSGLDGPGGNQQVQQLEAENAMLRQALQAAQQAAGRAEPGAHSIAGGSDAQLAELQSKLGRLQGQLRAREEQHERQLRMLKQEHQRLRTEEGIRWVQGSGCWLPGRHLPVCTRNAELLPIHTPLPAARISTKQLHTRPSFGHIRPAGRPAAAMRLELRSWRGSWKSSGPPRPASCGCWSPG